MREIEQSNTSGKKKNRKNNSNVGQHIIKEFTSENTLSNLSVVEDMSFVLPIDNHFDEQNN